MTAGLPGTGIGGLYYLLLVLLMPVRELFLFFRGRSSWPRWRVVGLLILIVAGMIAALRAQVWFISWVFSQLETHHMISSQVRISTIQTISIPLAMAAWITFAVLAMVIIGMYILRLVAGVRTKHRNVVFHITADAAPSPVGDGIGSLQPIEKFTQYQQINSFQTCAGSACHKKDKRASLCPTLSYVMVEDRESKRYLTRTTCA